MDKELIAKREQALGDADAAIAAASKEARAMTEDERTNYNKAMAAVKAFDELLDAAKAHGEASAREFKPTGKPVSMSAGVVGLTDKEVKRYSLVSAIRNAAEGRFDGTFEAEVSKAASQKLGKTPRGFFLPQDIMETRTTGGATLLEGTTNYGGNLVATELLSGSFIEILRNRMVCARLGATFLTGLVGHIAIPKATAAVTAYWVAEDTDITVGRPQFGQLTLAPVTLGAAVDISRKLLLQSSIDVERFVQNDIAQSIAIEIDRAAIHGTGTGEPTGILNTVGINSCPASATTNANANPSWTNILSFESAIQTDNADFGTMAWAMNPATVSFLKKTAKSATAVGEGFLMGQDMILNGYRVLISNQISAAVASTQTGYKAASASAIILANWGQLIMAFWSGLDVLVNPYSASLSGTVRIVAHQDVDFGVRQPTAFAAGVDYDFD
jgi:HK97 family phage major capsid protein